MHTLHFMNASQRNANVAIRGVRYQSAIRLGIPGRQLNFLRYVQATEKGLHETLTEILGAEYGQALIGGDPEVDVELIGRTVGQTTTVYLSGGGEVMHAAPEVVDVIYAPDGSEKERRVAEDTPSNVREEVPVRWTGRKLPKAEVVRRFAFKRTIQLQHVDGLTYDFLYAMAKELHDENALVLIGGGDSGKEPLVMQTNGIPYRGFLEGRIDGEKYQLLLHLSNMELKRLH
jgi:hypothetical protein